MISVSGHWVEITTSGKLEHLGAPVSFIKILEQMF